ncbi:hypothetical protein C5Y96_22460 [Blastopirellula marina]|uniref:Uncharacterized protein n=1 Tax=Blastopirellula marina TaxID=124 RepID=A0A2S8F1Z4_9BACT|nr:MULTISPECIES: hypothetical protein [Pirellulaceae]PQO26205.1 hypothetical protein C5Y96_22460 [Blastopirellula marina]RCS44564.1 hypothetical protein DTL36_22510 [Bremerella cremea]
MVDFTDREEVLAEVLPSEPARPKKITIIVVIAIILALLYLLGFLSAVPMLIMHVVSPGGFNFTPPSDDPQFKMQAEMQAEMQAKMAEVTQTYFIPLIILAFASLAVGVLLLYGSIQCLRRREVSDYRLLNNTFIFAMVLIVGNTITTVLMQIANWNIMESTLVMPETPNPQAAEMVKTFMMIFMAIGVGLGVAFQVAQFVYFAIARWVFSNYITTFDKS